MLIVEISGIVDGIIVSYQAGLPATTIPCRKSFRAIVTGMFLYLSKRCAKRTGSGSSLLIGVKGQPQPMHTPRVTPSDCVAQPIRAVPE